MKLESYNTAISITQSVKVAQSDLHLSFVRACVRACEYARAVNTIKAILHTKLL